MDRLQRVTIRDKNFLAKDWGKFNCPISSSRERNSVVETAIVVMKRDKAVFSKVYKSSSSLSLLNVLLRLFPRLP